MVSRFGLLYVSFHYTLGHIASLIPGGARQGCQVEVCPSFKALRFLRDIYYTAPLLPSSCFNGLGRGQVSEVHTVSLNRTSPKAERSAWGWE